MNFARSKVREKQERRTERLISESKLPIGKTLDNYDFSLAAEPVSKPDE